MSKPLPPEQDLDILTGLDLLSPISRMPAFFGWLCSTITFTLDGNRVWKAKTADVLALAKAPPSELLKWATDNADPVYDDWPDKWRW